MPPAPCQYRSPLQQHRRLSLGHLADLAIHLAHGGALPDQRDPLRLLIFDPGAQKQAEASECAFEQGGDKAFWRYTDALYERTLSGGKGFPLDQLKPLAMEQGLDGDAFQQCLDSGRYAERVNEDFKEVAQIGITGTPGNILRHNASGEVIQVSGARSLSELQQQARVLTGRAANLENERSAQAEPSN